MYRFTPDEVVQSYGQVTTLGEVFSAAQAQGKPYVYMLDGCGMGNGVVWPADRQGVASTLTEDFAFAKSMGRVDLFVQIFENIEGVWEQFPAEEMHRRLGL